MRNGQEEVVYVGKARNLRKRVGSYFTRSVKDGKTQALLRCLVSIEVTVTGTEQEALLLEYNLIKAHRPRFNVLLRDDKSYPYIRVTTSDEFPRFEFHRGARTRADRYLGPFPGAGAVRSTLQQMQKLFRVRQCSDSFFSNRSRPCLQYQIGRCSAPCVGLISSERYGRDVQNAIAFIAGNGKDVLRTLVERMEQHSARQEYEEAARCRDQIASVRRVQEQQVVAGETDTDLDAVSAVEVRGTYCVAVVMIRGGRVLGSRAFFPRVEKGTDLAEVLSAFLCQHYPGPGTPPEILVDAALEDADLVSGFLAERSNHAVLLRHVTRGKRRRWIKMAADNAVQAAASHAADSASVRQQLNELASALDLEDSPERLECFDISHTQGGETVAACVVFGPAGPIKSDYRRFNIRQESTGDDYAALAEAVRRRYQGTTAAEAPVPDLILVDGGAGQVARVAEILQEIGMGGIPLRGIAKGVGRRAGHERIFRPETNQPMKVSPATAGFRLLCQARDEAHRFALMAHRERRRKRQIASTLEEVDGLGPKRRRALLQRFGGLQAIARAGIDDLAGTPGVSRVLAERVYSHFRDSAEPAEMPRKSRRPVGNTG